MPVVEISRIQVRRGQENQTGVPVLESGEFGWSSDTENLYIGLRRIDGGARDANVRILTENDLRNFFSSGNVNLSGLNTSSVYTFKDGTGVATTTTSWVLPPTAILEEFVRTIQDKLDDFVSVKDFGAIGDGINDDSGPIQAAITNLYLSDRWSSDLALSTGTEKILYFPKGDYRITQRIYMPGKTKLQGEGKDSTVIIQASNDLGFFATVGNDAATNPTSPDDYFPANTAQLPDFVSIEKMTLIHKGNFSEQAQPFIQLNCSAHSYVRDVRMIGSYTSTATVAVSTYSGIELRGLSGIAKTSDIGIENCEFKYLCTGVRSNHDIDHINIANNVFTYLDRGVVFNDQVWYTDVSGSAVVDSARATVIGPKYAKIENNHFDFIFREGFLVGSGTSNAQGTGTFHISANNNYVRVGSINDYNMNVGTGTAIIKFSTFNNLSRNDNFYRYDYKLDNYDNSPSMFVQLIEGHAALESDEVKHRVLSPSANSSTVILLPISDKKQYVNIKYHFYNLAAPSVDQRVNRRGTLDVYVDPSTNYAGQYNIPMTDNYNNINDDASTYSDWITNKDVNNRLYSIKLWNKLPTGTGATFNVENTNTVSTGSYSVTLNSGGSNYQVGDVLTISGIWFNTSTAIVSTSTSPANDISITITSLSGSSIDPAGFTVAGTAPLISNTFTFFISTTTNSRVGGAGTTLYFDYQISTMTA